MITLNSNLPSLSSLKFRKPFRFNQKKYEWGINGVDTETEKGMVRIIADQNSFLNVNSLSDCLNFLTQYRYELSHNFFYNLHYDVECIAKFDKDFATELFTKGKAEIDNYKITYIPKKMFKIVKNNRRVYYFTDIAQFYRMSLAEAGEKYLNKKTHALKSSRSSLFDKYSLEEIGAYCVDDAMTTKRLGELYLSKLNSLGLFPKICISAGNLSQIYVLQNANVPHLSDIPKDVWQMYYKAYRGGWFDCYRRGRFKAWQYDISSAYPKQLEDLPDLRFGNWKSNFDDNAVLGVIRASIRSKNTTFHPIASYGKSTIIYPYFDERVNTYLTLREYELFKSHYDISPEVVRVFVPSRHARNPYRDTVQKLYAFKQRSKSDHQQYTCAKQLINSLYGKTIEKVKLPDGKWRIGKLFNPLFAAEITAGVRCEIFKQFSKEADNIIAIHTDSVITRKPFNSIVGGGLGAWECKNADNDLIMLRSGIYQFENEPITSRGFRGVDSLFNFIDKDEAELKLKYIRPQHVKECLRQNRFDDIGVFQNVEYNLNLVDEKRIWLRPPKHFNELLNHTFNSTPIPFSFLISGVGRST